LVEVLDADKENCVNEGEEAKRGRRKIFWLALDLGLMRNQ